MMDKYGPMLLGVALSGVVWFARLIFQMNKDIDAAHAMIRQLKETKK